MAYRDDVEALRAKLSVLERQAARVPQLESRIEELEAENATLRSPKARPKAGTTVNVELTFVGPRPTSCIKAIRSLCSLGLKEAKELVEAAPTLIKRGVAEEEAVTIKKVLEDVGAKVTIVAVGDLEVFRPTSSPKLRTSNAEGELDRVYVDPKVVEYVNDILSATRAMSVAASEDSPILSGARPADAPNVIEAAKRVAVQEARGYVTPSDVSAVLGDVLEGRVVLSQDAIGRGATLSEVLALVLGYVDVP